MFVLRLVHLEGMTDAPPLIARLHPWLVEYDPNVTINYGDCVGPLLKTSERREQARRFKDASEARDYWMQTSGKMRPDGKPDRPLTAFTVMVEQL